MRGRPVAVWCSAGWRLCSPLAVDHAGHQRRVDLLAAAQHQRGLAVVQPHERARRAQPDGAHERIRDLVAALVVVAHDGAHRIRGAAPRPGLAGADHGRVAVDRAQDAGEPPCRRQRGERSRIPPRRAAHGGVPPPRATACRRCPAAPAGSGCAGDVRRWLSAGWPTGAPAGWPVRPAAPSCRCSSSWPRAPGCRVRRAAASARARGCGRAFRRPARARRCSPRWRWPRAGTSGRAPHPCRVRRGPAARRRTGASWRRSPPRCRAARAGRTARIPGRTTGRAGPRIRCRGPPHAAPRGGMTKAAERAWR